jgi:uncharacterized BrkB/YihY/UPF0761 family membrane protein
VTFNINQMTNFESFKGLFDFLKVLNTPWKHWIDPKDIVKRFLFFIFLILHFMILVFLVLCGFVITISLACCVT